MEYTLLVVDMVFKKDLLKNSKKIKKKKLKLKLERCKKDE
jgi:hypothetical protein